MIVRNFDKHDFKQLIELSNLDDKINFDMFKISSHTLYDRFFCFVNYH